ncbi:hypothetical protein FO519_002337 [Halicephalobus sp. NKZ332]|nr:hypothetical protein FO519_002337 [Halicephalobus sp. NKZ332]
MTWILGLFGLWILIVFPVDGSLKDAKIHPELPLVELKQHRHNMDQLEPDLAQNIFDGVQRNPLERTTTIRPNRVVKSPSLREKRDSDSLPIVKPAEVRVFESLDSDPFSASQERDSLVQNENEDKESEKTLNQTSGDSKDIPKQTFIIEESLDLGNPPKETIIDEIQATITSPPLDGATVGTTTAQAPVTEKSQRELRSKTTLLQEVPTTTPKYNFSHNSNSPTANLDRKILAFEVDYHNKQVIASKTRKPLASLSNAETVLEKDPGLLKAQEDEKKQLVPQVPDSTARPDSPQKKEGGEPEKNLGPREFQNEEILPQRNSFPKSRRTLLDSSVSKTRRIVSNYVRTRTPKLTREEKEEFFQSVVSARLRRSSEKESLEDAAAKILRDEATEEKDETSGKEIVTKSFEEESNSTEIVARSESNDAGRHRISGGESTKKKSIPPPPLDDADLSDSTEFTETTTAPSEKKKERHILSNIVEITTRKPKEVKVTTEEPEVTEQTTVTTTEGTTVSPRPIATLPASRAERLKLLDSIPPRRGAVLGLIKTTQPPNSKVDEDSAADEEELDNPWQAPSKTHIQLHLTDENASDKDVKQPDIVVPKKSNVPRRIAQNNTPPRTPQLQNPTNRIPPIVSPPQQFFQQPQQVFQQPQQVFQQPFVAPVQQVPSPSANPSEAGRRLSVPSLEPIQDLPLGNQGQFPQSRQIARNGNARSNASPADLVKVERGHRVRNDEINIVRIFQHYGTTKQAFVRPMSTQPFTTTEKPTVPTTKRPKRVPVTLTTRPTPTTPSNEVLITTRKPIGRNHVKHTDFDLYDEVDSSTSSPTTLRSTTSSTPRTSTTTAAPTTTVKTQSIAVDALKNPKSAATFVDRDSPISDPLDYVTDEELEGEKAVRPAKNIRQSLRLVKLRNYADSDVVKTLPARDFVGNAPNAKPDLQGFSNQVESRIEISSAKLTLVTKLPEEYNKSVYTQERVIKR